MGRWVVGGLLAALLLLGVWGLFISSRDVGAPPLIARPPLPPEILAQDTPATRVVRVAHQGVNEAPDSADAWYQLGLAYVANSAEEPARASLKQATLLAPQHARAWYLLAILADQEHDPVQAIACVRRALSIEPTYAPGWCRLGEWLLEQDDRSGALDAFQRAIQCDPGLLRAAVGPARVALAEGRPQEALAILDSLIESSGGAVAADPLLRQLHLTARIRGGTAPDLIPATRATTLVLNDPWLAEADPFRADRRSRAAKANQYMTAGRPEAAIALLEGLNREDPDNPATWCNLVAAHRTRGDLRRSAELGEEAVRRFPDSEQPYLNLALTRLALGRHEYGTISPHELDHAIRLLDAAIARNPASAQSRAVRAGLHALAGELSEAIEQYRLASVADPANPTWFIEQGRAEPAAARRTDAIQTLHRAVRLDGAGAEAAALLHAALGEIDRPAAGAQGAPP